ncbi:protein of unknown function [Vibrio tapetis subsp. tapetis]|uniref:Uncharacterized protein n=1 Tax=Vibrio tapetis subsp. tapetis TaxID=1671868 RepID=A0A2N8ZBC5_9VIBR|nr:protein of unknown function [Vibrio tapetis subsp. tapetis]
MVFLSFIRNFLFYARFILQIAKNNNNQQKQQLKQVSYLLPCAFFWAHKVTTNPLTHLSTILVDNCE